MSYDDMDLPNTAGTRGKLGPHYTSGKRKHDAKRAGHRRVRRAFRTALHVEDDRPARRVRGSTAWDID